MFQIKHWFFLVILSLGTVPDLCLAQVNTATIYGTVMEPSGASVRGANVTANNEQTGATYSTTTGDGGEFTFTFLPVGRYSVVIRASGFKEERQTGLELMAGKEMRLKYLL